jgi:uncharacterized protein YceK
MRLLPIFISVILITGCASVGSKVQEDYTSVDKGIYPGVRGDISWLKGKYDSELQGAEPIIYPLAFFDLPIAAVLDTVLLPTDILEQHSKLAKIRKLAGKYFPHYKLIENVNRQNVSRFSLLSPTGDKIDFEKTVFSKKLSDYIQMQGIIIPSEQEAQEVVQLILMITFGDVDIVKGKWHYEVNHNDTSWRVLIKNNHGGSLGNAWILNVNTSNHLEGIVVEDLIRRSLN